ncbi:MAG: nicotinamide-nucleotide amidohydrolase family protein [Gemmatimonadales bacterium]|nr:nicotinamide-nucleotide amidohydrolase family protein [Gemmatimonadales bacterium]
MTRQKQYGEFSGGKSTLLLRIIAVGDELLEGRTADTNSQKIQRAMGLHVVQAAGVQVVPDRPKAIAEALDRTREGDLVFLCGGLGSTPDDLTREAVSSWAGVELAEDPQVRRILEDRWKKRGVTSRPGLALQCQVPAGMTPLENPVGSAPGLAGRLGGRIVILLPGVPAELEGLLPRAIGWLAERELLPAARSALVWRTAQAPELAVVRRCREIQVAHPDLQWAFWLTEWGVDVRLAAESTSGQQDELAAAGRNVDRALGHLVYAREMESLPEVLQKILTRMGRTLSTAESCTAGLLAGRLTDAPGSSAFYRGGIIAYADEVKQDLLGVSAVDLERDGAVSGTVVKAMAAHCRDRLETDYSLAVSGISGPDGGTEEKPVGTTWVAVATPENVFARRYKFTADRARNRLLTIAAALDSMRRILQGGDGISPFLPEDHWGG